MPIQGETLDVGCTIPGHHAPGTPPAICSNAAQWHLPKIYANAQAGTYFPLVLKKAYYLPSRTLPGVCWQLIFKWFPQERADATSILPAFPTNSYASASGIVLAAQPLAEQVTLPL